MTAYLRNDHGAAMMIALGVLLMLGVLGTAAVQTAKVDMDIAENFQHDVKSLYVADAGAEHAYAVIRDSLSWRTGFTEYPFAGGDYTVVLIDRFTIPALDDTIVGYSLGRYQGAQTVVEFKLAHSQAFRWALYSDSALTMCGTSYTDSYDSDSGSYAATMSLTGGDVGSNGQVDLCGDSDINGDATSSTPGEMDIYGSADVNDTSTTAPLIILDPVPQSEIDDAENNNIAPGGLSGSFTYNAGTDNIRVLPTQILILADGVYFFNDFDISGTIQLAPGASVRIYLVGDAKLGSQAKINITGKPVDFQIYSVGDEFRIAGGAEMRAVVYAPETEFSLTGGADLYGAFVGDFGSGVGNTQFHYDRSLGELPLLNILARISWREVGGSLPSIVITGP